MRYAICNETFEGWDHARICPCIAGLGYTGLEVAPFTLAGRITEVPADRRKMLRQRAEEQGVTILGLHWLLAKTEGLCVTAPDAATRSRTAAYLVDLARCCRELGGDIMVFGSPAQRRIPAGHSAAQAMDFACATFGQAAQAFGDLGVRLCLEPLGPQETDFLNTCAQACELIDRIGHPNFCLHLDVKAMATESIPTPELIRRYAGSTGHFHANDPNKRGPGFGATDFMPIFQALQDTHYAGWVSVEVFDYTPDPETIARDSIRYMRACEQATRPG